MIDSGIFGVVNAGEGLEREITKPFCCDLLSIAMGRAPEGCAWVTVMGNMNTLAVASLADAACVIMAEGAALDEAARKKAADQEITVLELSLIHIFVPGGRYLRPLPVTKEESGSDHPGHGNYRTCSGTSVYSGDGRCHFHVL